MTYVEVSPEILRWAIDRSQRPVSAFERKFPKLPAWLRGEAKPTLKQLESFARSAHAPVGYFFLSQPPEEPLPLPDFRTIAGSRLSRPSPDLLETLYTCQMRQDWYRDFARANGEQPLDFVGTARLSDSVSDTAARIRDRLGFDLERRRQMPTWTEALRQFLAQADEAGVLVMVSGIVGTNTRRVLDPREFRGFTLADPLAPLIFINGADTKAAQMFTLAHELAHVWLGRSALSDAEAKSEPAHEVERWCNQVASELLVPLQALQSEVRPGAPWRDEAQRLARVFKVSTLVILRRMFDARALTHQQFEEAYRAESKRLEALGETTQEGGDFYATLGVRVGRRFARAVVASTLEGHTLFRDACRLMGIKKESTFRTAAKRLGFAV
jgi:Zn-dependent peptidase ImmA (M78 family)